MKKILSIIAGLAMSIFTQTSQAYDLSERIILAEGIYFDYCTFQTPEVTLPVTSFKMIVFEGDEKNKKLAKIYFFDISGSFKITYNEKYQENDLRKKFAERMAACSGFIVK